MKTAVALLACLAGANAFTGTPLAAPSSKSALQMSVFDDYIGAVDFRGKKFEFDPVSFWVTPLFISLTKIAVLYSSAAFFL